MLDFNFDATDSIVYLRPTNALEADDFVKLAATVDPHIEKSGKLAGLIVEVSQFPGWDSFGALAAHLRFVRDHHRKIRKIALVTNAAMGNVVPRLASHFVAAEIKRFSAGEADAAKQWILSDD